MPWNSCQRRLKLLVIVAILPALVMIAYPSWSLPKALDPPAIHLPSLILP